MKISTPSPHELIAEHQVRGIWWLVLIACVASALYFASQEQRLNVQCGPERGVPTCTIERWTPLGGTTITHLERDAIFAVTTGTRLLKRPTGRQHITLRTDDGSVTLVSSLVVMSHFKRDALLDGLNAYREGAADATWSIEQDPGNTWLIILVGFWIFLVGYAFVVTHPRRLHVEAGGSLTLTGRWGRVLSVVSTADVERVEVREVPLKMARYRSVGYPIILHLQDGREVSMLERWTREDSSRLAEAICDLLELPRPPVFDPLAHLPAH